MLLYLTNNYIYCTLKTASIGIKILNKTLETDPSQERMKDFRIRTSELLWTLRGGGGRGTVFPSKVK